MHQKINLYQSFVRPTASSSLLSWKRLWIINVAILIIFILIYLFSLWDLHQLQTIKNQKLQKLAQVQLQFNTIKNTLPSIFFSQDANQSLEALQKNLEAQEKVLVSITNAVPFSKIFLALARLITPNVWLTQITISKGATDITLKGQSSSMGTLQLFLNNLGKDALFSNSTWAIKNIEDVASAPSPVTGQINFEIQLTKKTA